LGDILSDDIILRFYQCVKDVKNQQSPKQTSAMFFALCHALGDSITFLKVPNVSKVLFHQQEQIYAVKIEETQSEEALTHHLASIVSPLSTGVSILQPAASTNDVVQQQAPIMTPKPGSSYSSITFSSSLSPSSYSSSPAITNPTPTTASVGKRLRPEKETAAAKRTKKPSPRDKLYSVRRRCQVTKKKRKGKGGTIWRY
jgi:hypothetical protein